MRKDIPMKFYIRLFSVVALLICIWGLAGCQTEIPQNPTQTTVSSDVPPTPAGLVLVSGGQAKVQLIRSEDTSDKVTAEITRLYKKIYEVTGVELDYTIDFIHASKSRTEAEERVPAILVGQTNYSASETVLAEMTYGQGVARVVGEQLVLAAVEKSAISALIDELCAYIEENGSAGELVIPADYSVQVESNKYMIDIPVVIGGHLKGNLTDAGDGAYGLTITDVSEAEYNTYRTELDGLGLTCYSSNEIGDNRFVTLVNDEMIYNYIYTPVDKTLRIIVDERSNTALPPLEAPTYTKVCESALTQLGIEYNYKSPDNPYYFTDSNFQNGMGYIFRLEDGSFILIDGGFNTDYNSQMIWDTLNALSADYKPDKITIAAWIITHAHGDHFGAFRAFMGTYGDRVQLNYVIYDLSSTAVYRTLDKNSDDPTGAAATDSMTTLRVALATYAKKENTILTRPGQTMKLANADIEIFFTDEFLLNDPNAVTGNALSIHFRITIAGQTFMFAGDSYTTTTDMVVRLYGKELASDFVQVIHHGTTGGTEAYYQCVDPIVVLWPLGEYDYFPSSRHPDIGDRDGQLYARSTHKRNAYFYSSTRVREVILAGHTTRTLALPYAYPAERVLPVRSAD